MRFAALLLPVLAALASGPPQDDAVERPPHERIAEPAVVVCGDCHRTVWQEWSQSLHARAWTNENVRQATRDFERLECRPCHSPRSVLETGLDRPPTFRTENREDGVHCLSCHGRDDGVAAARTVEGAPCRPRQDARLSQAEHCWPCHEPTHQAFQEYRTSRAFERGERCMDCHMPEREDGGRSHGPHGGMDPTFVARALSASFERQGDDLRVTLQNRTGHKLPGEIPSRRLVVRADFDGAESVSVLLRKPNKGEERPDDRLKPDERRTLTIPVPSGVRGGSVHVRFLPLPLTPWESGFELYAWEF